MANKAAKNSPEGGLTIQLGDNALRAELELISDLYVAYLSMPLKSASELSDSAIEQYEKELQIVQNILNSGNSAEPLLINNQQELLRKMLMPKIGQRRLPDLFRGDGISKTNRLVNVGHWFDVWRDSDFDIYFQLEIAQCRALTKYKQQLEDTIKELNNAGRRPAIRTFNWYEEDKKNIRKLFKTLMEKGIIDSSESDFIECFGNREINDSKPKVKWLLTSKNGEVSKASLFYFIELLRQKKLITSPGTNIQNKTIEKLFTDANGKPLKNLKQSKYNPPKAADRESLEEIVKAIK
jgi:HPt (histidine-containing phosphotransfer) domain-containing protein